MPYDLPNRISVWEENKEHLGLKKKSHVVDNLSKTYRMYNTKTEP